jgi:hypothetical protein
MGVTAIRGAFPRSQLALGQRLGLVAAQAQETTFLTPDRIEALFRGAVSNPSGDWTGGKF